MASHQLQHQQGRTNECGRRQEAVTLRQSPRYAPNGYGFKKLTPGRLSSDTWPVYVTGTWQNFVGHG
eukprot:4325125-Prymnesium_polylepis.1